MRFTFSYKEGYSYYIYQIDNSAIIIDDILKY